VNALFFLVETVVHLDLLVWRSPTFRVFKFLMHVSIIILSASQWVRER